MSSFIEIFFVFLPYLKPHNITLIPELDLFFKIWKIVSTLWLIIKIFRKRSISKATLSVVPFCVTWIISMYINDSLSNDVFNSIMSIMGIHIYYEIYKDNKIIYNKLVWGLGLIAKLYLILQIVTLLIINGPLFGQVTKNTYDRFFLGGDNLSAFIMIVLTTIMFYADEKEKGKISINSWIIFMLEVVSLFRQFVGAAMVSFVIYFVLILLRNNKKVIGWITPRNAVFVAIVFVVLVAYGDLATSMGDILYRVGKVGFNGRTRIWSGAINAILKKPLLGYGSTVDTYMMQRMLYFANHTHNIVLEFLFETGLVGTFLFLYYLKNNFQRNYKIDKILLIGLFVYILNAVFDFYITSIYFYLLLLIMHWDARNQCKINI